LAAAGALVGVVALAMVSLGLLDLTASTPHPQGWANFLHYVFKRSVAHHAGAVERIEGVPREIAGNRLVRKGALIYAQECSHCHGGPGLGQNPVALSMRPTPQYLMAREDVYSPAELFWIVKHGVKYSAMPAWPAQSRDDEVWSLVAFVNRMPSITPAAYAAMTSPETDKLPPAAAVYDGIGLRRRFRINNIDNSGDVGGKLTPVVPFGGAPGGIALATCTGCHGIDGKGREGTGIPNIALLPRDYIKAQLVAFATGSRASGFMQQVAAGLTDIQMDELASYYAGQPKRRAVSPAGVNPDLFARGEAIISAGRRTTGVGACSSCHGQEGAAAVGFSRLNGQHPAYLRDQLRLYRKGLRATGPRDPMVAVARNMSDADITAVSWAYAAREPGRTREAAR
jgi:cytochrome c553